MKFGFDDPDKKDFFLKSRIESLGFPKSLENSFKEKSIYTIRGILSLSDIELEKIAGNSKMVDLIMEMIDKIALETNLMKTETENNIIKKESLEKKLDISEIEEENIIDFFAKHFGVAPEDITKAGRKQEYVYIRDIITYILREYADMSFPAIGELLGGRDHSTIIHSYKKIKKELDANGDLRASFEELIAKATAIRQRKIEIEEKLIPDLIASIREKQAKIKEPIQIPERNLKLLDLYKEGITLQELGNKFGVSRERARQIAQKTIEQIASNEQLTKGIEIDSDILFAEEKRKRNLAKQKGKKPKAVKKEKTWSRYYLSCRGCGNATVPHRRHGYCENCLREFGPKRRNEIIEQHSNLCDRCGISRADAIKFSGRDFYIAKDGSVLCRECFRKNNGKILGGYKNYPWSRFYEKCVKCGTQSVPHIKSGLCRNCANILTKEDRERIISEHNNLCDECKINRIEARNKYDKDFYLTHDKEVMCARCFHKKSRG